MIPPDVSTGLKRVGCGLVASALAISMVGVVLAQAPSTPTARTTLKGALATLQPKAVWANFYALTRIPRPSGHERAVSGFVADFGRRLGLETTVDSVGNVLIRKPATAGMERREIVALQAHLDMVPQKAPGKAFDFEKDAIEGFVEGGWVKADGTTLGGDDGIGVATIMAILQARDLSHGPIEALFTVDEEADGTGVIGLGRGVLNSRVLINLDGEKEGTLWIGSAGGVHVDVNTSYPEETVPAGMVAYALEIAGLQGGHSGLDIDKGHGSAAALLARLLWDVGSRFGVRVASLASGDLYNVIPRQATAALVVPADRADALTKYVAAFERTVRDELAATEPSMFVRVTPAALPPAVMATAQQRALVGAVYASPNGVTRMSDAVPGLVETSCNLGILAARGGTFRVGISVRSAVDSARDDLAQRLMALFRLAGAEAVIPGDSRYSAFRPNPKSAVLSLMTQAYKSRFGVDPTATAIHAGLEVSDIGAKHPGMDMISVGPTVLDVHSQKERVDITSVQKLYDLLEETLRRMPDRR